jgi:chromosome segregation ATPase
MFWNTQNKFDDLKKQVEELNAEIAKLKIQCGNIRKLQSEQQQNIKNILEKIEKQPEEITNLREFLRDTASANINILVKHFKDFLETKPQEQESEDQSHDSNS